VNRHHSLTPIFVEFIPEKLNSGLLYVSRRYRTSSHLCCCGCGLEVVTPLNPAKWKLSEHADGSVSLSPSVGNWSFPCKSHYWVSRNKIQWATRMSAAQIAAVQARDKFDANEFAKRSRPLWLVIWDRAAEICRRAAEEIRNLWH
jgi:hypothetical protein